MSATYNVSVPVVELVQADSPEDAIRILVDRLMSAGFEPYDDEVPGFDAFESEPVGSEAMPRE